MQKLFITLVFIGSLSTIAKAADRYDFTVAQDGSGNFSTLQAAIDSVPSGLTKPFKIFIKNGKYKERVRIPATKPFIQLIGESVANTIITYNSAAKDSMNGRPVGSPIFRATQKYNF